MPGRQEFPDFLTDTDLASSGMGHRQLEDMVNWWLCGATNGMAKQIHFAEIWNEEDCQVIGYELEEAPAVQGTGELAGVRGGITAAVGVQPLPGSEPVKRACKDESVLYFGGHLAMAVAGPSVLEILAQDMAADRDKGALHHHSAFRACCHCLVVRFFLVRWRTKAVLRRRGKAIVRHRWRHQGV